MNPMAESGANLAPIFTAECNPEIETNYTCHGALYKTEVLRLQACSWLNLEV